MLPLRSVSGWRVAALLSFSLALSSCTTGFSVAPELTGAAPTPAELRASLERRERGLSSFRGQAKMDYVTTERRTRTAQMISVRQPRQMRIDVMNPFGVSYTLALDGVSMAVVDHLDDAYYEGAATASNLARFTGIPLDVELLVDLARGLPPDLGARGDGSVRGADGAWLWQRDLPGGGHQVITFDATHLDPKAVDVVGVSRFGTSRVEFGRHWEVAGVRVAHDVAVRFEDGRELKLVYDRIWPAAALPDRAFQPTAPPAFRRVRLHD